MVDLPAGRCQSKKKLLLQQNATVTAIFLGLVSHLAKPKFYLRYCDVDRCQIQMVDAFSDVPAGNKANESAERTLPVVCEITQYTKRSTCFN